MATKKHTKGRMTLDTDSGELLINDTILIANVYNAEDDPHFPCCDDEDECDDVAAEARANANRLVACWNACIDMADPTAGADALALLQRISKEINGSMEFARIGKIVVGLLYSVGMTHGAMHAAIVKAEGGA